MKNFTYTRWVMAVLCLSMTLTFCHAQTLLHSEYFNTSSPSWTLASNATISNTTVYEGANCLRFRGSSSMTAVSPVVSTLGYNKIDVKFFLRHAASGSDQIILEYRATPASSWQTVRTYGCGEDIATSNTWHAFYGTLFSTDFAFGLTSQFRFSATLGSSTRYIYLDKLTITGTTYNTISTGPGGITSNLEMWLKADKANGTGVGTDNTTFNSWQDVGKGNDANVIDADNAALTNRPIYYNNATRNVNFNPVVYFGNDPTTSAVDFTSLTNQVEMNGTGGFYTQEQFIVVVPDIPTTVTSTTASTDIFCAQATTTTAYDRDGTGFGFGQYTIRMDNEVISYCHGTTPNSSTTAINSRGYGVGYTGTSISHSGPSIISSHNNAAATAQDLLMNALVIDNTEVGVPQFANHNNRRYWLGRSQQFDGSFGGRIAEVITYSARKNDTSERRRIESYLAVKYGITLGVNGTSLNYEDSNGTIIWNATTNAGFCYNIAGIGRDDASELNQKQSQTVNTASDITIGLTTIEATNSANTSTFGATRRYLMWGNNNATLAAQPSVIVNMSAGISGLTTNVDFVSIGRTWKVVETGGDVGLTKISIPSAMLTATITPPGDFLMFISNSSTFSPTSEYRVMTVNGSNLETTYDFTGTKFITFGYAPERTFVRSIDFDGVDDYLDAGNVLNLNSNFTVSAWIKRTGSNQSIVSKRNTAFSSGYDLKINTSGRLEMSWMNGTLQTVTSTVAIPANIWHNVAVTFDGTSVRMYLDGVLNVTQSMASVPVNTENFLIAAAGGPVPTAYFDGAIDEVRVFGSALTAAQIRYIMNQEIRQHSDGTVDGKIVPQSITLNDIKSVTWSTLRAYYPMSTYTYTNAKDESDNHYTAALRNLTTVDYQTAPLPYVTATDGNWNTPGTWTNNTMQDFPYGLSIIDGTTRVTWNIVDIDHNVISTGNKDVLSLDLATSKTLTADNDTRIGVSHYLLLNGKIDLVGKSQLLQTTGSDLAVTSAGSIERDQQGSKNIYNYNYWSSPVGVTSTTLNNTDYTISGILRDGSDSTNPVAINWTSGYNGAAGNPITLSSAWIYKFGNLSNDYANWQFLGQSGTLKAGEGFTMKGSGTASTTQNYTFRGKPNNGQVLIPIAPLNLNLCGNPYASALDANDFISDNLSKIDGTLYFWEHYSTNNTHNLADYQGGYAAYSLTGGVPPVSPPGVSGLGSSTKTPQRYIPVGQAFFVTANSTGGNITFNNNQRDYVKEDNGLSGTMFRSAQGGNGLDDKDDTVVEDTLFPAVRIGFTMPNDYHRQLLLGFMGDSATSGIDAGYDAILFDELPHDMYFLNGENKLVISGEGNFDTTQSYPLGVKVSDKGLVKFSVDQMKDFPEGINCFLYDAEENIFHNLSESIYELTLPVGTYNNRFSIRFSAETTLGTDPIASQDAIAIRYETGTHTLVIENDLSATITSASLFNMLGQNTAEWDVENMGRGMTRIPIKNQASGTYIVKLLTSMGPVSRKIVIR